MITQTQKEFFGKRGLLRLQDILPVEKADRSRGKIFRLCEKHGAWKDGSWHRGAGRVKGLK